VIEQHPRLYVSKAPACGPIFIPIYTYQFDTANKPVGPSRARQDKRVRQAILAAVTADEIIRRARGNAIRNGDAAHVQALRLDRAPPAREVRFQTAPTKLLADAGFPEGIDLVLNSPDGRYPERTKEGRRVGGRPAQPEPGSARA